MKRNAENLKLYKETCDRVMSRADNFCEVMLDEDGRACSNEPKVRQCAKRILPEEATYTNFLHTATRNGKSDEWVLDPESIIFGCSEHHYEEETRGPNRVQRCEYGEIAYIPDAQ